MHILHIYSVYCKYPDITIILTHAAGQDLENWLVIFLYQMFGYHSNICNVNRKPEPADTRLNLTLRNWKLWETASLVLSKSNNFLYAFINIAYMFNMQTQQCVPV